MYNVCRLYWCIINRFYSVIFLFALDGSKRYLSKHSILIVQTYIESFQKQQIGNNWLTRDQTAASLSLSLSLSHTIYCVPYTWPVDDREAEFSCQKLPFDTANIWLPLATCFINLIESKHCNMLINSNSNIDPRHYSFFILLVIVRR